MSNVQVLHIEKRVTIAAGLNRHITRIQWDKGKSTVWVPSNADSEKTKKNVELVSREFADSNGNKKTLSLQQAVDKRIKEAGIKPRKNQSKCIEMIFSGSSEVMCNMSREQVLAWANDTLKWAQDTWGKDNVVSASLHVDEKTPHIHMIVVPIVKGQSRRSKKQNELDKDRGVARNSYKINHDKFRLCCNEVYTIPMLYHYHDDYAAKVSKKYGLERGLRAEPGSKKKHQTSEDYNRQLAAEAQETRSLIKELQTDYETTKEKTEEAQKQQKEAEDRKAAAERQAEEKEYRIKELEEKTISLSEEIDAQGRKITIIDSQEAALQQEVAELTRQRDDVIWDSAVLRSQLQDLKKQVDEKQHAAKEVDELETEASRLKAVIDSLLDFSADYEEAQKKSACAKKTLAKIDKLISSGKLKQRFPPSDGFCRVQRSSDNRFNFIDLQKQVLLTKNGWFDEANDFCGGLATVFRGTTLMVIDTAGVVQEIRENKLSNSNGLGK